jgi:hypothetical protein
MLGHVGQGTVQGRVRILAVPMPLAHRHSALGLLHRLRLYHAAEDCNCLHETKVTIMHWIDPDCLPEISGEVERFIVNVHGEVDGMLISNAKCSSLLIHTPPHMEADIESAIQIGDTIGVRGVRLRGADMIAAVALIANGGLAIVDRGPDDGHENKRKRKASDCELKRDRVEAEGRVRLSLFGPKGELRGALLDNGAIIRVGPKEAVHLAELLRPDSKVAVRGDGFRNKHGHVVAAKEIGSDLNALKAVKGPKHKDKPRRQD